MTAAQEASLVEAFHSPFYGQVGPWWFEYEYPGVFVYRHPSGKSVHFTPDYEEPGTLVIQVANALGDEPTGYQVEFTSMRADDLFELVKPFLKTGSGRKEWDPRKELSGRKDWDPRAPEPIFHEAFLAGYLNAAVLEAAYADTQFRNYSVEDIAPGTRHDLKEDTAEFLRENWEDLRNEDPREAGRQFYLARNKDPMGFSNWPNPEAEKRILKSVPKYGGHRLYLDDDGLLRAEPR